MQPFHDSGIKSKNETVKTYFIHTFQNIGQIKIFIDILTVENFTVNSKIHHLLKFVYKTTNLSLSLVFSEKPQ